MLTDVFGGTKGCSGVVLAYKIDPVSDIARSFPPGQPLEHMAHRTASTTERRTYIHFILLAGLSCQTVVSLYVMLEYCFVFLFFSMARLLSLFCDGNLFISKELVLHLIIRKDIAAVYFIYLFYLKLLYFQSKDLLFFYSYKYIIVFTLNQISLLKLCYINDLIILY